MMNCIEITRSVTEFLERRLKLRTRIEFLIHIAMCRGCRTYVAQIRASIAAMRSLSTPTLAGPPIPIEILVERFREEARRREA